MKLNRTLARRLLFTGVLGVTGTVLFPAMAWAHVTISPNTGTPGGYVREAFQVPNERDDASTSGIQVFFPTDHPLASVSVEPVPGWTSTVQKVKLSTPIQTTDGTVTEGVSSITWTGGSIGAGQFQEFPVTVGPLPGGDTNLTFKVLQTYSDGQVVRWIDLTQDGQPEPDHPAPVLSVAAPAAPVIPATTISSDGTSVVALVIGGAGLLAGLGSLGWIALGRRRATPTEQPKPTEQAEPTGQPKPAGKSKKVGV